MATAVFSATFDIKDLFNDPQVKKALREREDRYNENMLWLDEDWRGQAGTEIAREWNKQSVCDEEWRNRCLRDLTLLDGELWHGSSRSIRARERWTSAIKSVMKKNPLSWHCGMCRGRAEGGDSGHREECENGLANNYGCVFHNEEDLTKKSKRCVAWQVKNFKTKASVGDIIYLHNSTKSQLTHWGVYHKMVDNRFTCQKTNNKQIKTEIHVDKWIPLSEPKMGVGKNSTLYEVKLGDKNYENYMIFT